jgi:hypothetical protein
MAVGLTALALEAVVILAAGMSRLILLGAEAVSEPNPEAPTEAEAEGVRGV